MPMTQNIADYDMGANLTSDKLRNQQQEHFGIILPIYLCEK